MTALALRAMFHNELDALLDDLLQHRSSVSIKQGHVGVSLQLNFENNEVTSTIREKDVKRISKPVV